MIDLWIHAIINSPSAGMTNARHSFWVGTGGKLLTGTSDWAVVEAAESLVFLRGIDGKSIAFPCELEPGILVDNNG